MFSLPLNLLNRLRGIVDCHLFYTAAFDLNDFFGHSVNVSGLVTGGDLIRQLRGRELGERLLLPVNMLRHGERVFLDDVSLDDVERELGVPVTPVAQDGYELLDAMCGLEVPPMEQVQLREETEYYQYNP